MLELEHTFYKFLQNDYPMDNILEDINQQESLIRDRKSKLDRLIENIIDEEYNGIEEIFQQSVQNFLKLYYDEFQLKSEFTNDDQNIKLLKKLSRVDKHNMKELEQRLHESLNQIQLIKQQCLEQNESIKQKAIIKNELNKKDEVRQNIVEFKNEIVDINNMIVSEFQEFKKYVTQQTQQQTFSQASKLKQYIIQKTIGEKKKETNIIQISPQLQKAQHNYFKRMTSQFEKIKALTQKVLEKEDACQQLQTLWEHFILINFLLNEMYQNIDDKNFHFLNFYVSVLTQVDGQIDQFLEQIDCCRLEDKFMGQLEVEKQIKELQLKFKKNLNALNRQSQRRRKIEFSRDL